MNICRHICASLLPHIASPPPHKCQPVPLPPCKCQPAVSQVPACRGIPSVLTTRIYGLPRRRTISPRCRRAWLASRRSSGKSMPHCKRRSLPSACLRNGNHSRPRHNIKPTLRKLAHNASGRCRNTCFCPFCMLHQPSPRKLALDASLTRLSPFCMFWHSCFVPGAWVMI